MRISRQNGFRRGVGALGQAGFHTTPQPPPRAGGGVDGCNQFLYTILVFVFLILYFR